MIRLFAPLVVALGLIAAPVLAQSKAGKADYVPPKLPKLAPATQVAGAAAEVSDEDVLLLDLSTGGRVKIVMRPDVAPKHVERIRTLVREGFYNGTIFHRVIDGFMAQGGDPTGTGTGGSKLPDLDPEFNELPHVRGAVSMARAQTENSANSQFFIIFQPTLKLDRNYTVWGRVVDGMQYVDAITRGEPPENPTRIVKASIAADHVPPPANLAAAPPAGPAGAPPVAVTAPPTVPPAPSLPPGAAPSSTSPPAPPPAPPR